MVPWQVGIRLHLAMPGAVWEKLQLAQLTGEAARGFFGGEGAIFSQDLKWFNMMTTMHASVMIFTVIIPGFAAFANYVVPMMIGARDMAFPKMNAFRLLAADSCGCHDVRQLLRQWWCRRLWLDCLSAACPGPVFAGCRSGHVDPGCAHGWLVLHLGAINFIVTCSNMRAPGMGWMKMPLFAWAVYITSIIQLVATPVLGAAVTMLLLDRNFGTGLLDATKGGDPILYQHIFWFYSHPAVYIMILPGFGAISHIFSAFSRKKVFGYTGMVYAIGVIAILGFMVWAHHMFAIGMPVWMQGFFMWASMAIGVPTGIKVFSWLATLWGGTIKFTVPMCFGLGFISLFVLGGFGGLILALVPIDYQLHDTYFVVGHFHYTLVGGSIMLLFASTYYWWPKMTGRFLNENCRLLVLWPDVRRYHGGFRYHALLRCLGHGAPYWCLP